MKPTMTLTQEETPVAELQLRPEVRQRLEATLSTYATLQEQIYELQAQADLEKSKLGKLLADYGYDRAGTDTHSLTWVRGAKQTRLDKVKLIAQGVSTAQIDAATVSTTKRDYFQIRRKGTSGDGLDE